MGDQIVTGLSFASDLCRDGMGQVSWTNYRLKKSKTNAIRFFLDSTEICTKNVSTKSIL